MLSSEILFVIYECIFHEKEYVNKWVFYWVNVNVNLIRVVILIIYGCIRGMRCMG